MDLGPRLIRLGERVEVLPRWARAPVYGALFLVALIGLRGGVIGIPIIVVGIVFTSDHVARDLLIVAAILGTAILGGAASGIAYTIAKRWVQPIPVVGRALAGMVIVAPYMVACTAIVHAMESPHWNDPIGGIDLFVFALCTILFGLAIAAE